MGIAEARRRLPPLLAELEEQDQQVRLRASIDDLMWMARLLVGLGCPIVIHRPSELREAFQTLASELWAIAGSAIISAEPLTPPYD